MYIIKEMMEISCTFFIQLLNLVHFEKDKLRKKTTLKLITLCARVLKNIHFF